MRTTAKRALFRAVTALTGNAQGEAVLRVLAGPGRGLRLGLDLVTRQESAYWWGSYERPALERLLRVVRPGWVVWDCGTYLGYYSALLARRVGAAGQVVAIEPDPRNLERTRANVRRNGFTNVRYVHGAIAAASGEVDFLLQENTNSHIPGCYVGAAPDAEQGREDGRLVRVPALALDDAARDGTLPRPQLIKLDIEGAEELALPSAREMVRRWRPLLCVELHNPACDAALWHFAGETGYTLQSLDTGRPMRSPDAVGGTVLATPPVP